MSSCEGRRKMLRKSLKPWLASGAVATPDDAMLALRPEQLAPQVRDSARVLNRAIPSASLSSHAPAAEESSSLLRDSSFVQNSNFFSAIPSGIRGEKRVSAFQVRTALTHRSNEEN